MGTRTESGEIVGPPSPGPRPPAIILDDHPALDFVNTRAFPGGQEVEWLADGHDLVAWLGATNLCAPKLLADATGDAGARRLDAIAAEARALREWFRGFVEGHAGKPLGASAARELGPLNALLGEDNAFRSVEGLGGGRGAGVSTPGGLAWRRHRRKLPLRAALLLPVADAIGDLVTAEDFMLVRRCEGTGCSLVFLDRTKSHARRWCSMAWCGNRAKAAAHRARHRRDTE